MGEQSMIEKLADMFNLSAFGWLVALTIICVTAYQIADVIWGGCI